MRHYILINYIYSIHNLRIAIIIPSVYSSGSRMQIFFNYSSGTFCFALLGSVVYRPGSVPRQALPRPHCKNDIVNITGRTIDPYHFCAIHLRYWRKSSMIKL